MSVLELAEYDLFQEMYNRFMAAWHGNTLHTTGCMSDADARSMFEQLLAGLQHLRDRGYVHCDVKLDNVLLYKHTRSQEGEDDEYKD